MSSSDAPQLWAIVVTYHRPTELADLLSTVARQTRPPDHIVVIDNGSDRDARSASTRSGAIYLDAGGNLGPAGGIALGMRYVISQAKADDWVLSLDDDDPPPHNALIEVLWQYAHDRLAADPLTAGVGGHGADYNHRLGVFRRFEDEELRGDLHASVVAGGSLPMYRCAALRAIGVFDRHLFFGFEEGDFGLRIKKAGLRLYVRGETALEMRRLWGQAGRRSENVRTARSKAAWRRYYSTRNSTLLAWRYAAPFAPLFVAAGGAVKGTLALIRLRRPWHEVVLPARGAVDGLLRRTGRTLNPATSFKSHGT